MKLHLSQVCEIVSSDYIQASIAVIIINYVN